MSLEMYLRSSERLENFTVSDYIELDNSRINAGEDGVFNELAWFGAVHYMKDWFWYSVMGSKNEQPLYEVSKEQLKELHCDLLCEFNSSQDMDEAYTFGKVANQIEDIINQVDFDNEIVFYKLSY